MAKRILNLCKYNAHTEPIFKELKLLTSTIFSHCKNWNFISNIKTGNYHVICQSLPYSPNSDIHDHETRIQHNIHELKTGHDYTKRCIWSDLSKVIDSSVRQILDKIYTHSLQSFSGYIKQHILNSYQENYNSDWCMNIEVWTLLRWKGLIHYTCILIVISYYHLILLFMM